MDGSDQRSTHRSGERRYASADEYASLDFTCNFLDSCRRYRYSEPELEELLDILAGRVPALARSQQHELFNGLHRELRALDASEHGGSPSGTVRPASLPVAFDGAFPLHPLASLDEIRHALIRDASGRSPSGEREVRYAQAYAQEEERLRQLAKGKVLPVQDFVRQTRRLCVRTMRDYVRCPPTARSMQMCVERLERRQMGEWGRVMGAHAAVSTMPMLCTAD